MVAVAFVAGAVGGLVALVGFFGLIYAACWWWTR